MNVASLELCKELYEVSGWYGTSHRYYVGDGYDGKLMDEHYWSQHFADECIREGDLIPAYDSGYLLRKLPAVIKDTRLYLVNFNTRGWSAMYTRSEPGTLYKKNADTPENALCKLAIELLKQGVLSKEEK